jgi:ribosomal protein S18 acetylase RimI-like enzyme
MQIRSISQSEMEAARQLLVANGWRRRGVRTAEEFAELVGESQIALVAVDGGQVVGFLRALTDRIANGYISMVVVDERFRNRGIGRAMVQEAIGDDPEITWVLRAGRAGVASFYEKIGFSRSDVAMERRRAVVSG